MGSKKNELDLQIFGGNNDNMDESSMVYVLTPELKFTPSTALNEKKNFQYKIGSVLPLRESRTVEYKTGGGNYPLTILPLHIQKYGSAFLNSEGGVLIIGVADDGCVAGIHLTSSLKAKVLHVIDSEFKNFTPSVDTSKYEVDFVPCNKKEYYVLEVLIRPGDPSTIYSDRTDKVYVRRDGSVQGPLWPRYIKELVTAKLTRELESHEQQRASGGSDRIDPRVYPLIYRAAHANTDT